MLKISCSGLLLLSFLTIFMGPEVGTAAQFFYHALPVPTLPQWRAADGFHFQVQNPYDGSYHFGYDTGAGKDESYREESRDAHGRVQGRYGYVDPNGILRTVEYLADEYGFRTRSREHMLFDTAKIQLIGPIPKPATAVARKYYNPYIKSVLPSA